VRHQESEPYSKIGIIKLLYVAPLAAYVIEEFEKSIFLKAPKALPARLIMLQTSSLSVHDLVRKVSK